MVFPTSILLPTGLVLSGYFLSYRWYYPIQGLRSATTNCITMLFYPCLVWYALSATAAYPDEPNIRVSESSTQTEAVIQAFHAFVFYDWVAELVWGRMTPMTFLHHLVSVAGCTYSLYSGEMQYYICSTILTEVSTIFLCAVLTLQSTDEAGARIRRVLPTWVPICCGLSLWVTFLVFRILYCPLLVVSVVMDGVRLGGQSLSISYFLFLGGLLVLTVLNCLWFRRIHLKMLRILFGQ
jgi:hypothetical protein